MVDRTTKVPKRLLKGKNNSGLLFAAPVSGAFIYLTMRETKSDSRSSQIEGNDNLMDPFDCVLWAQARGEKDKIAAVAALLRNDKNPQ